MLVEIGKVNVSLSQAVKTQNINQLQSICPIIQSTKGSSKDFELNFAPLICQSIEESLIAIKESNFSSTKIELTNNLLSLLEDYFVANKTSRAVDEDFAVKLQALFGRSVKNLGSHASELRVLIVEESTVVTKKISSALSNLGIYCSHSTNGLEAFNRLNNEFFDVVVVSKNLSKISGTDLINILQISRGKNPNIKTCLITSSEKLEVAHHKSDIIIFKDAQLTEKLIEFLEREFKANLAVNHKALELSQHLKQCGLSSY